MSETPVSRLMLSMGIPMIISMLLQAFYNIVDSAFVSNMKDGGEAEILAGRAPRRVFSTCRIRGILRTIRTLLPMEFSDISYEA